MSLHVVLTCPHALQAPGGGLVHCRGLAEDLARVGVKVTLMPVESLTMSMWPRPVPSPEMRNGPAVAVLRDQGIEIVPLRQNRVGWWFDGLAVRRALLRILDRRRVDVVLGWWAELAYSLHFLGSRGIFVGTLAAAPYTLWWKREPARLAWLHRMMDRRLVAGTARGSDQVFANSTFTAGEVVRLLGVEPERVEVVHPPVSGRFAVEQPSTAADIQRLIYFGRLEREKGVFDLVEALAPSIDRTWTLTVAGSGQAGAVVEAARDAGIEHRVELLGEVDVARLSAELARSDLAILPSYAESFGLSVAEAQVAGLPVIAYEAGAVGEVMVPGETGWLVPTGRIDLLARAIAEALDHPEETRRRGVRARAHGQGLKDHSPAQAILDAVETWRSRRAGRGRSTVSVGPGARRESSGVWNQ